jgi:hypothetical protein
MKKAKNKKSVNLVPNTRPVFDIRDADITKNGINGLLNAIDSGLRSLAPIVGTTREFTDIESKACEFGLNIAKFTLQTLNTLHVGHK